MVATWNRQYSLRSKHFDEPTPDVRCHLIELVAKHIYLSIYHVDEVATGIRRRLIQMATTYQIRQLDVD